MTSSISLDDPNEEVVKTSHLAVPVQTARKTPNMCYLYVHREHETAVKDKIRQIRMERLGKIKLSNGKRDLTKKYQTMLTQTRSIEVENERAPELDHPPINFNDQEEIEQDLL